MNNVVFEQELLECQLCHEIVVTGHEPYGMLNACGRDNDSKEVIVWKLATLCPRCVDELGRLASSGVFVPNREE